MNKIIIILSIVLLIATAISYGITRNDTDIMYFENTNTDQMFFKPTAPLTPLVLVSNPNFTSHHSAIEINLTSGWMDNFTGLKQIKLINQNRTICLNLTTFDRIECLK